MYVLKDNKYFSHKLRSRIFEDVQLAWIRSHVSSELESNFHRCVYIAQRKHTYIIYIDKFTFVKKNDYELIYFYVCKYKIYALKLHSYYMKIILFKISKPERHLIQLKCISVTWFLLHQFRIPALNVRNSLSTIIISTMLSWASLNLQYVVQCK